MVELEILLFAGQFRSGDGSMAVTPGTNARKATARVAYINDDVCATRA